MPFPPYGRGWPDAVLNGQLACKVTASGLRLITMTGAGFRWVPKNGLGTGFIEVEGFAAEGRHAGQTAGPAQAGGRMGAKRGP